MNVLVKEVWRYYQFIYIQRIWTICLWFSEYTFVVETSTNQFCTKPSVSLSGEDTLLRDALAAVTDNNASSCFPPFAETRTLLQAVFSISKESNVTDVRITGLNMSCEPKYLTVYFAEDMTVGSHSITECFYVSSRLDLQGGDCSYQCRAQRSTTSAMNITVLLQAPNWGSQLHRDSLWCEITLWTP